MRMQWRQLPQRVGLAALLIGALAGCALQPTAGSGGSTGSTGQVGAGATATATSAPAATQAAAAPTATSAPPAPSPTPNTTCQPNQLSFSVSFGGGAAGHIGQQGKFTNTSSATCTLYGFPGAQMLDAQHNPITTHALWQTSAYMYSNQQKQTVTLAPGGAAYFAITWSDVTVGSSGSCPTSAYLSVTPPNDFSVLTIADQINACDSNLEISPVEPTAFMGG